MTVHEFLASLPTDPEAPERASRFQELVREAGQSATARQLARDLYRLAASGAWPQLGLHDANMLVYSLLANPELAGEVAADVRRMLHSLASPSSPLLRSWRWVQRAGERSGISGAASDSSTRSSTVA